MSVTKQDIARHYGIELSDVKQINSKQLFIADIDNGTVLISYYTIVGKRIAGIWYLTGQKYSVTTSRQLTQFASGRTVVYVDDINSIRYSS